MSPLLFNLCVTNLDRIMKKRNISGVDLGKDRIRTLTYVCADNMLLLAYNREAII